MKKILMSFVVVFSILAVGLLCYMFTRISDDSKVVSNRDNNSNRDILSNSTNDDLSNNNIDTDIYRTNDDNIDSYNINANSNLGTTITNFVNDILNSVDLSDVNNNVSYNDNSSNGVFNVSSKLVNTQTLSINDINSISIVYNFFDVTFYPSKTNELVIMEYMNYTPSENELAQITRKNDILTIKNGRKENLGTTILPGNNRVDIYLPADYCRVLSVATTSGNISSNLVLNLEQFNAACTSGNISFNEIIATDINIATTSGSINIDDLSGGGNISTTSGSINLILSDDITSLVHDISITASSGSINLILPPKLSYNFKAKTSSGTIQTSFDKELNFNKKGNNASGTIGNFPNLNIEIAATSGSVHVDK